jgi:hypothetical protein
MVVAAPPDSYVSVMGNRSSEGGDMTSTKFDRFLPISGIIAGLLFAAANIMTDAPGVTASAAKHVKWFEDHKTVNIISGVASGYFFVAMVFFAVGIRAALRARENARSTHSSVAYAGGILVALAVLGNGLGTLISVEAADHKAGDVIMVMSYVGDLGWLPWAAASAVLFLGTGIGGLATKALPKWLSIVTVVLGVASMAGPTGILVFFATPFWLITTGIVLSRRLRSEGVVTAGARQAEYAIA